MLYSSVYTSVPGTMVSLMKGSMVFCCTLASRLITTCPPRCIIPKTGGLSFSNVPRPACAFESAAASLSALVLHHLRLAFMAGNHIGFIALHLVGQRHRGLFFTIPSRNCVVICCTSLPLSANSWAICSFDTFSPMK